MAAPRPKNTVKETALRHAPQGGVLRTGNPGNRGGTGRRPDRIKKLAQKLLLPRVVLLAHIADGVAVSLGEEGLKFDAPTAGERIRALEALAKIGGSETVTVADVRERLRAQLTLIRSQPTWNAEELVQALAAVW